MTPTADHGMRATAGEPRSPWRSVLLPVLLRLVLVTVGAVAGYLAFLLFASPAQAAPNPATSVGTGRLLGLGDVPAIGVRAQPASTDSILGSVRHVVGTAGPVKPSPLAGPHRRPVPATVSTGTRPPGPEAVGRPAPAGRAHRGTRPASKLARSAVTRSRVAVASPARPAAGRAVDVLTGQATAATGPADTVTASVGTMIAPVGKIAAQVTAPVREITAPVEKPLAPVEQLVAPIGTMSAPITRPVAGLLQPAHRPVEELIRPIVAPVVPSLPITVPRLPSLIVGGPLLPPQPRAVPDRPVADPAALRPAPQPGVASGSAGMACFLVPSDPTAGDPPRWSVEGAGSAAGSTPPVPTGPTQPWVPGQSQPATCGGRSGGADGPSGAAPDSRCRPVPLAAHGVVRPGDDNHPGRSPGVLDLPG
jgi:hypothetical protein